TATQQPSTTLAFSASVLEHCEGRTEDLVTLEEIGPGQAQARWTDGHVPRVYPFEPIPLEQVPDLPRPPAASSDLPPSFLHAFDADARYPDVRTVIPKPSAVPSRLRIDRADAAFLITVLPKMPANDDEQAPITLDLAQRLKLRVRSDNQTAVTEVELVRS